MSEGFPVLEKKVFTKLGTVTRRLGKLKAAQNWMERDIRREQCTRAIEALAEAYAILLEARGEL